MWNQCPGYGLAMMKWNDRIKLWMRDEPGRMSVAELARRAEVNKDALHKWLKGGVDQPRGDALAKLAKVFNKTEAELRYGVEIENQASKSKIPLLSMNEIGTLDRATIKSDAWEGRSVNVATNDIGDGWIAVEIADESCVPVIQKGDIVYCDPDADIEPGNFVIAKLSGLEHGVCRRYRATDALDKRCFKLVALNEDYPEIESTPEHEIVLIARVMKKLTDL